MSDIVISVQKLSKRYALGKRRSKNDGIRHVVEEAVRAPLKWMRGSGKKENQEDFWALKDVTFDVKQGDVLGVIGRNGAGKSTLLKVLSRITEPTHGRIQIEGRVASLLEVGTGFHPELTGRENIYLNGAILGMSRAEIRRKFDEIVAFSEVETFLDTPVKRYSSGMYVRLAFAVAAHLEPEILIIDEVLAVGDAEFQKKCMGKIGDVSSKEGRTVLFVSHNTAAMRTLCTRGLVFSKGQIVTHGSIDQCIREYEKFGQGSAISLWTRPSSMVSGELSFSKIASEIRGEQPFHKLKLTFDFVLGQNSRSVIVAFDILDSFGTPLMQALPSLYPFLVNAIGEKHFEVEVELPPLVPGQYWVSAWVGPHNTETLDLVRNAVAFDITHSPTIGRTFPHANDHGFIAPVSRFVRI